MRIGLHPSAARRHYGVRRQMILRNVLARPARTAISVLAVALEVSLVMLVVGLTGGMLRNAGGLVRGTGADVMVEPPGASPFLGLSTTPLPAQLGKRLARFQHISAVTPVLLQFNRTGTQRIWGIQLSSWNRVTGGFAFVCGGPFQGPNDALVDVPFARQMHLRPGRSLTLLHHRFRVSGVVKPGKGAHLFVPLATAQRLSGRRGEVSLFLVQAAAPRYGDRLARDLKQLLPHDTVISVRRYVSLLESSSIPAVTAFNGVMIGVAATVGFLVIFLAMYTATAERTREIGILKSIGASRAYIVQLFLAEAAAYSALGIVVGYLGAWAAWALVERTVPLITMQLTLRWAGWAALLAATGSLLGAWVPARRAARLDPIDALAYE